jgi:hypothetical protein
VLYSKIDAIEAEKERESNGAKERAREQRGQRESKRPTVLYAARPLYIGSRKVGGNDGQK